MAIQLGESGLVAGGTAIPLYTHIIKELDIQYVRQMHSLYLLVTPIISSDFHHASSSHHLITLQIASLSALQVESVLPTSWPQR